MTKYGEINKGKSNITK